MVHGVRAGKGHRDGPGELEGLCSAEVAPVAVVTGASTGIGRAVALKLANKGWKVFACVPNQHEAQLLGQPHSSITTLLLDVTQPQQVAQAAEVVGRACQGQGLHALVNNAGCPGPLMPLELLSAEAMEAVLQVNVMGVVRVTQALLPLLRQAAQQQGAVAGGASSCSGGSSVPPIVNSSSSNDVLRSSASNGSSMGQSSSTSSGATCGQQCSSAGGGLSGRPAASAACPAPSARLPRRPSVVVLGSQLGSHSFPLYTAYAASKHALEALADSLRYELRPQGLRVCLVKPGPVQTPFYAKYLGASRQAMEEAGAGRPEVVRLYLSQYNMMQATEATVYGLCSSSADQVADRVVGLVTAQWGGGSGRYVVGWIIWLLLLARKLLPDCVWDPVLLAAVWLVAKMAPRSFRQQQMQL